MTKKVIFLLTLFGIQLFCSIIIAQRRNSPKRTFSHNSSITSQRSYEQRWRYGVGFYTGINTGIGAEIYKLSNICTRRINATKFLSIDLSVHREALMFSPRVSEKNEGIEPSDIRYGLSAKYHFFWLYGGVGIEGGNRYVNNNENFSTDITFRIGLEGKLYGFQQGQNNLIHISWFIEEKYNKGLDTDFYYLLPVFGIRVNFL